MGRKIPTASSPTGCRLQREVSDFLGKSLAGGRETAEIGGAHAKARRRKALQRIAGTVLTQWGGLDLTTEDTEDTEMDS